MAMDSQASDVMVPDLSRERWGKLGALLGEVLDVDLIELAGSVMSLLE